MKQGTTSQKPQYQTQLNVINQKSVLRINTGQEIPSLTVSLDQNTINQINEGIQQLKPFNTQPDITEDAQTFTPKEILKQQCQQLLNQQANLSQGSLFDCVHRLYCRLSCTFVIVLFLIGAGCIIGFWVYAMFKSREVYDLVRLDSTSARCIDGSPYAYYLSRTGNQSKILLLMVGGAWCGQSTPEKTLECFYNRSKSHLGSTLSSPPTRTLSEGILSNHEMNYFRDWKKAFLLYCDGSGYQGTRKEPISYNNTLLYLRGQNNTVEAFDDLQKKLGLLSKAQTVVLSGESAGGVAVYTWANYLHSKIEKGRLLAISDSGIFYDTQGKASKSQNLKLNYANLMNLANQQIQFPVHECVTKYPNSTYNCMFVQNLFQHIKVPIFHLQSVYDKWVMEYTLKVSCMGKMLERCGEEDREIILENRQNVTGVLNRIGENKRNGVWGTKCLSHVMIVYGNYVNQKFEVPFQDIHYVLSGKRGLTAAQAIALWMEDPSGKNVHIDHTQLQGDGFCQ